MNINLRAPQSLARRMGLFTVAAFVAPLALACGSKDSSSGGASGGGREIIVYDTGIEEANRAAWAEAIRIFETGHPDVTVKHKPFKDDDYSQGGALIAALRSKNPPQIYYEWSWAAVRRDAANGVALDLTPLITDELKAMLDPRAFSGTSHDGKTMMVPFGFDVANMLFYRKKPLEERGLALPETWEQFVETCRKLRADGLTPILQGNQAAWPAGNWASELAAIYLGPAAFEAAGDNPPGTPLTAPGFLKAVTRLKELRDAGAFNDDLNSLNDNEGVARFTGGDGVFIFNGSWMIEQLNEAGGADAFGVMPRPRLPEEPVDEKLILANSAGYMIHARAEDPKLMMELIQAYVSPQAQTIRVKAGLNTATLEAQKAVESPLQKSALEILAASGDWVAAPDIAWKERFTAERFYEAVSDVVGGQTEPLAALQQAEKDVTAKLKE